MRNQHRAYTIGSIEHINTEWIFFEEESEEASLLSEIVQDGFEILYEHHWIPAHIYENDMIKIENILYKLQNRDTLRVPKKLLYSYEEWLKGLSDSSFLALASSLKAFEYSLYDCLFCHNSMQFIRNQIPNQGVNFILYDNGDLVCSLHHHYVHHSNEGKDTFIFTRADGETKMIENE